MSNNYLENNYDIYKKLELQIISGYEALEYFKGNYSIEEMSECFISWRRKTQASLSGVFEDNTKIKLFLFKTDITINKFSKDDTKNRLIEATKNGIDFIQQINADIKNDKANDMGNRLNKASAIIVIRSILQNFYKHIQVMYQEEVHGNGTIKKKDLDAIQIGNEYDVQRILYSIIRTIFTTARVEVSDDTGYKFIRYDIKIDEYDIVIEVKCTRKSMTERNLTEELGSDAFHYNADYVFFFIYDKENIIKNIDAFIRNYKRQKNEFGINVETIVNQSISI
jgi:hypothetical protein